MTTEQATEIINLLRGIEVCLGLIGTGVWFLIGLKFGRRKVD